jgi:glycosyltransferase involved in cell wall biosynthesis
MKVLLVIRSLNVGGAERQVVATAKELSYAGHTAHIAIFEPGGSLEHEIEGHDSIKLHVIKRSKFLGLLSIALKIRKLVNENDYDALYGFLPIPNLALLGSRLKRNRPRIVWGVRSSNLDMSRYSQKVRWSMTIERFMSKWADSIVSNSSAARYEYIGNGYQSENFSVIHNMVNVERFKPRPETKQTLLGDLGITAESKIVGIFARIHHKKDHATFLRAAARAVTTSPQLQFLCVGGHSPADAKYVDAQKALAEELGIANIVHWLGERTDPELLMNVCTVTTLTSSNGEGFPNSVAESLSCGIPCVATDSGETRLIINDDDNVVSPNDPDAIAAAWLRLISLNDDEIALLGPRLRSSIINRFSPSTVTEKIVAVLSAS